MYELKTLYFPGFLPKKVTLKSYYGAFSGNLKRVFLRKMHFCVHPFQPKNDHFWSPEGPFLAKNLENKVFLVHTIQNIPIWNPNVAPKKVTIFDPRESRLAAQGTSTRCAGDLDLRCRRLQLFSGHVESPTQ